MRVYIVKSFGPDSGWVNLRAFTDEDEAVRYADNVGSQIPLDITDEFVEVEELTLEGDLFFEEPEVYDAYGVNTANTFNTPPKG
jgi:hypothetical protein